MDELEQEQLKHQVRQLDLELAHQRRKIDDARGFAPNLQSMGENLEIQQRFEETFRGFETAGAPPALNGESPVTYRRRLLNNLCSTSKPWAKTNFFSSEVPEQMCDAAEREILRDAKELIADPRQGSFVREGQPRIVSRVEPTGHRVTEYFGDDHSWMAPFQQEVGYGFIPDPRHRR